MAAPAQREKDAAGARTPALPPELRELLGIVAFVLVMLAFVAALFGISYLGSHLSTLFQGHCWEVQSAGDKPYEIDTCTGRTRPLPAAPAGEGQPVPESGS